MKLNCSTSNRALNCGKLKKISLKSVNNFSSTLYRIKSSFQCEKLLNIGNICLFIFRIVQILNATTSGKRNKNCYFLFTKRREFSSFSSKCSCIQTDSLPSFILSSPFPSLLPSPLFYLLLSSPFYSFLPSHIFSLPLSSPLTSLLPVALDSYHIELLLF